MLITLCAMPFPASSHAIRDRLRRIQSAADPAADPGTSAAMTHVNRLYGAMALQLCTKHICFPHGLPIAEVHATLSAKCPVAAANTRNHQRGLNVTYGFKELIDDVRAGGLPGPEHDVVKAPRCLIDALVELADRKG